MSILIRIIISLLCLCCLASRPVQADLLKPNKLCRTVVVRYDFDLKFTDSERRLLCGSKGVSAWEHIPLPQAQFSMRNFLEARGYNHPTFESDGEILYVNPGRPTLINEMLTEPTIEGLDLSTFWLPQGKPLTPEALDSIEKWVALKLSQLGYPCATVKSRGDPDSGLVIVYIDPGKLWTIEKIEEEPIPYVRGGMLARYRAFHLGERYDGQLLEISSERLRASQVVINSQYRADCSAKTSGTVMHTTLAGAPRLVSFGLGFDTENLLTMRGSWRNSRLSETASLLNLSSTLSYRKQNVLTAFDWYYLPIPSRHYLKSYLRLERAFEPRFESRSIKGLFAPALTWDRAGLAGDIYFGPALQFEWTQRGEGPSIARLLTMDLGLSLESHLYEFYRSSPQTGFRVNAYASASSKDAASDISANSYVLDVTRLWNLMDMDPEIWILGLRASLATTRPGVGTDDEDVPASFRYFLGGSEDLRGFARGSVPNRAAGALTKAYLGTELRLNNILPHKIQPLLSADWGRVGSDALQLDRELYWSPGLGLRWESPVGTIRASLAHGVVVETEQDSSRKQGGWQLYVSLGEQF